MRRCQHCDGPIPETLRAGTKFCSPRCRSSNWARENAQEVNAAVSARRKASVEIRAKRAAEWRKKYAADDSFRERRSEHSRAYKLANRDRATARERARKAAKRGALVEHVDRDICFSQHDGICGICHEPIIGAFHVDHVIPLSRGGEHSYANCAPAHPLCNQRKSNKLPEELAA